MLLVGEELSQGLFTAFLRVSQDHFAHGLDLLILEEHVLCAAKTNTHGAEATGNSGIVWSICVRADDELRVLFTEGHQLGKVTCELCGLCLDQPLIDFAGATIEREVVAFLEYDAVDLYRAVLVVNVDSACTRYTALTHTTGYDGSMRSHPATCGENPFCS